MPTPAQQQAAIITAAIKRTVRRGGFPGKVAVSNVRGGRDGAYSARVVLSLKGGKVTAVYRADIRNGHVRLSQTAAPARTGK